MNISTISKESWNDAIEHYATKGKDKYVFISISLDDLKDVLESYLNSDIKVGRIENVKKFRKEGDIGFYFNTIRSIVEQDREMMLEDVKKYPFLTFSLLVVAAFYDDSGDVWASIDKLSKFYNFKNIPIPSGNRTAFVDSLFNSLQLVCRQKDLTFVNDRVNTLANMGRIQMHALFNGTGIERIKKYLITQDLSSKFKDPETNPFNDWEEDQIKELLINTAHDKEVKILGKSPEYRSLVIESLHKRLSGWDGSQQLKNKESKGISGRQGTQRLDLQIKRFWQMDRRRNFELKYGLLTKYELSESGEIKVNPNNNSAVIIDVNNSIPTNNEQYLYFLGNFTPTGTTRKIITEKDSVLSIGYGPELRNTKYCFIAKRISKDKRELQLYQELNSVEIVSSRYDSYICITMNKVCAHSEPIVLEGKQLFLTRINENFDGDGLKITFRDEDLKIELSGLRSGEISPNHFLDIHPLTIHLPYMDGFNIQIVQNDINGGIKIIEELEPEPGKNFITTSLNPGKYTLKPFLNGALIELGKKITFEIMDSSSLLEIKNLRTPLETSLNDKDLLDIEKSKISRDEEVDWKWLNLPSIEWKDLKIGHELLSFVNQRLNKVRKEAGKDAKLFGQCILLKEDIVHLGKLDEPATNPRIIVNVLWGKKEIELDFTYQGVYKVKIWDLHTNNRNIEVYIHQYEMASEKTKEFLKKDMIHILTNDDDKENIKASNYISRQKELLIDRS